MTAVAVCSSYLASAQLQKGAVQLGGGISVGETKRNQANYNNDAWGVFLQPSLGFTVKDLVVAGIRGSYARNYNDYNNVNYDKQKTYGLGLFVRKYLPLGKNFFLLGDGGIDYSKYTSESSNGVGYNTRKTRGVTVSLFPGITYAINRRFLLELAMNNLLTLSYNKDDQFNNSGVTTNYSSSRHLGLNINASTSGNLSVGFRIVL